MKKCPETFNCYTAHTLLRSTKLFSRNHSKLCFCLVGEVRQRSNIEQLLYQINKSSYWRCSRRKAVLKHFAIFRGKHLCWSLFFSFIKKRLQHRCFTVANFLRTSILKNIYIQLLLN